MKYVIILNFFYKFVCAFIIEFPKNYTCLLPETLLIQEKKVLARSLIVHIYNLIDHM